MTENFDPNDIQELEEIFARVSAEAGGLFDYPTMKSLVAEWHMNHPERAASLRTIKERYNEDGVIQAIVNQRHCMGAVRSTFTDEQWEGVVLGSVTTGIAIMSMLMDIDLANNPLLRVITHDLLAKIVSGIYVSTLTWGDEGTK